MFRLSDPPPSYDSLFGQVRAARQESTGFIQFFKKFLMIILSTSMTDRQTDRQTETFIKANQSWFAMPLNGDRKETCTKT